MHVHVALTAHWPLVTCMCGGGGHVHVRVNVSVVRPRHKYSVVTVQLVQAISSGKCSQSHWNLTSGEMLACVAPPAVARPAGWHPSHCTCILPVYTCINTVK